jgi:hypothetical protein
VEGKKTFISKGEGKNREMFIDAFVREDSKERQTKRK